MTARRFGYLLLQAGMAAYSVWCLLVVAAAPVHEYDWMLDDPVALAEGLTFCILPQDDRLKVHLFPAMFLAPLWASAFVHFLGGRRERWLWVALALTVVWLVRSSLPWMGCANPA